MKVHELISALQKENPNEEVYLEQMLFEVAPIYEIKKIKATFQKQRELYSLIGDDGLVSFQKYDRDKLSPKSRNARFGSKAILIK